ncbi:MAG: L-rhamnose/proton symporter RhaT [Pirellulales bacterium]
MILGLLLSALGGGLDASQALVMGLAKRWRWESIWLVWALFGCVILPWAAAFLLLREPGPSVVDVFRYISHDTFVQVFIFGAGWGIGAILFGLGAVRVGMGLGLGITVSLTAANGALLPLVHKNRELLMSPQAGIIYLAVGLLVLGIILCSLAAHRRPDEKPLLERESTNFGVGVLCCIASGFTSPLINLAIGAGLEINKAAEQLGASALAAGMAPVALIMTAGFVVNAIYCTYLLIRNRSWRDFAEPRAASHWFYGALMGLLQMSAFLIYLKATSYIDASAASATGASKHLGGEVLGWPVYTASMILVGNLEGLMRGEWKGSDRRTLLLLALGLMLLAAASSVVAGFGSYLG